jgi:hypothetical protein
MMLADASGSSGMAATVRKDAGIALTRMLSAGAFRNTYGRIYGRFRIRKRSRMGADARIRWISNNGLEMVRKPVKTAGKRHGGGLEDERRADALGASERATAVGTWSRQDRGENQFPPIKPRGAGPIQALSGEALEYHRGAKTPL